MSIVPSHFQVDIASVEYQARTALATLADEIAATRSLEKAADKIDKATRILVWLQALDNSDFLTYTQKLQIVYKLIEYSGIYDFPTAPVLGERTRPTILIGIQGPQGDTGPAGPDTGTAFTSTSINGTSTGDTFAFSSGSGAIWEYTVTDGTNQRSGTIEATWLSSGASINSGADIATQDIGDTSSVVLTVDISAGNVRLRITAISTAYTVKGTRILIP